MSKNIIDANLLIRLLTNDDPTKAKKVEVFLQEEGQGKVLLEIVLAEVVWVLSSVYSLSKPDIVNLLRSIVHLNSVVCNKVLFDQALVIWETHNISFIDAYIAAKAEIENLTIYSYDRAFDKIPQVIRKEP